MFNMHPKTSICLLLKVTKLVKLAITKLKKIGISNKDDLLKICKPRHITENSLTTNNNILIVSCLLNRTIYAGTKEIYFGNYPVMYEYQVGNLHLHNDSLTKYKFLTLCIFSTNKECLHTHDPKTVGMAGMPRDLVNVKKDPINMTEMK